MITAKITIPSNRGDPLKALDPRHFVKDNGETFAEITLIPTPGNQYENDWMIVQSLSKEARDAGEKGNPVGNARAWREDPRNQMLTGFINLSKLDKSAFFKGEKGIYCDLVFLPLRTSAFAFEVRQKSTDADRLRGVERPVLGKLSWIERRQSSSEESDSSEDSAADAAAPQPAGASSHRSSPPRSPAPFPPDEEDEIPF